MCTCTVCSNLVTTMSLYIQDEHTIILKLMLLSNALFLQVPPVTEEVTLPLLHISPPHATMTSISQLWDDAVSLELRQLSGPSRHAPDPHCIVVVVDPSTTGVTVAVLIATKNCM